MEVHVPFEEDRVRHLSCRSDGAVQGRARALPLALVCLFMGGATFAARAIPEEEALLLVEKLRRVLLPLGWEITGTKPGVAPGDWHTFDPVGFLVEGRKGDDAFSVCFLPSDWIGIASTSLEPLRSRGLMSILLNSRYKAITVSTERRMPRALRKLEFPDVTEGNVTYFEGLGTASLVNSGWWRIERGFRGRFDEAQGIAERLIREHSHDEASRDEAAYSLVVLGVPAKNVFIERAVKGGGRAREFCISALGYFGGENSVEVLCRILEDPGAPWQCRQSAASSLRQIGDPAAGPSLVAALDGAEGDLLHRISRAIGQIGYEPAGPKFVELLESVENPHSLSYIARAVERIGYRPAAPKLLSVLVAAEDHSLQVACADALAALRYTEAVPAIRDLAGNEQVKNWWGKTAKEALIRLTTPRGEPSEEARLILVAPQDAVAGKGMNVKLYVENLTNRNIDVTHYVMTDGTLVVNGERRENRYIVGAWGPSTSLQPVRAWAFDYDLSQEITTPGRYSVKYEARGAVSNEVVFDVRGAQ